MTVGLPSISASGSPGCAQELEPVLGVNGGMAVWCVLFGKVAHGYSRVYVLQRERLKGKKKLVQPDDFCSNVHINFTVELKFLC